MTEQTINNHTAEISGPSPLAGWGLTAAEVQAVEERAGLLGVSSRQAIRDAIELWLDATQAGECV